MSTHSFDVSVFPFIDAALVQSELDDGKSISQFEEERRSLVQSEGDSLVQWEGAEEVSLSHFWWDDEDGCQPPLGCSPHVLPPAAAAALHININICTHQGAASLVCPEAGKECPCGGGAPPGYESIFGSRRGTDPHSRRTARAMTLALLVLQLLVSLAGLSSFWVAGVSHLVRWPFVACAVSAAAATALVLPGAGPGMTHGRGRSLVTTSLAVLSFLVSAAALALRAASSHDPPPAQTVSLLLYVAQTAVLATSAGVVCVMARGALCGDRG